MPYLSVVVPTYNRLDRLRQVLAALECQTYPRSNFEVIVVSDGSTDGTHEFLRTLTTPLQLRAVVQKNQGPAVARNRGIAEASGELVLFIDDDVVPVPTLLAEHVQTHAAHADEVVVLGPMLEPDDFDMAPWVRWEQAMLVKQYEAMERGDWAPTARQFYTGNTSLPLRYLVESGGFDGSFRRAEDVELAYRLAERGLRFVFNGRAVGLHYAVRNFRSWMEIPYAYGRNDVVFSRDKAQKWLLPAVKREFRTRNGLIRLLVWLCIRWRVFSRPVVALLKLASQLGGYIGVPTLYRMAFSGIFNLRYYEGVADELGGRRQFSAYIE